MIALTTPTARTLEPPVHVAALATIVQNLMAGGRVSLRDGRLLRERAMAAGLNRQERAALETLRTRLRKGGTALLQPTSLHWG